METAQRAPVLAVRELTVAYGANRAVDSVSLDVHAGEFVGLIGPNGAGKTSLLNAVSGIVKRQSGSVFLRGIDVSRASFARRCRLGLSRTFQIPRSSSTLTVEEQVAVQVRGFRGAWLWRPDRKAADVLRATLDEVGIVEIRDRLTSSLTLGEYRLFEEARAAASAPTVVLSDESASGMDLAGTEHLKDSLRRLTGAGAGVLLVEHNIPFVRAVADRLVVLDLGRVIATGGVEEVLASEIVQEAYMGHAAAA
jgi:branched-chain amino acid transport system ATP-binding protein